MAFLGRWLRVVIERLGREQTNSAQRLKSLALLRLQLPRINTPVTSGIMDL